jgi:membrane protease YdiL (CAAX protease family)
LQDPDSKPTAQFEIALVVTIFAGWLVLSSVNAVLAGFPEPSLSDREAIGIAAFESIAFAVAASVLWSRGWRANDFLPRISWWLTFVGVVLGGAALLVDFLSSALIGSLVGGHNFLIEFAESISLSLPVALLVSIVNGAYEEFFLSRYLLEALAGYGAPVALGFSALVRVACHLHQGPTGAVTVLLFGLILTLFYWRYREVWPVMVAHMLADFVAFV